MAMPACLPITTPCLMYLPRAYVKNCAIIKLQAPSDAVALCPDVDEEDREANLRQDHVDVIHAERALLVEAPLRSFALRSSRRGGSKGDAGGRIGR